MAQYEGPFIWNSFHALKGNLSDGYHFGDLIAGWAGFNRNPGFENAQPSGNPVQSFQEFYNSNGYGNGNPYSFGNKVNNFFTGKVNTAQDAYQNYLAQREFEQNREAMLEERKYNAMREDTAVQRQLLQYKNAGLNPYMLISSGSLGSAGASNSPSNRYKRKESNEKQENQLFSSALKILALILLRKTFKVPVKK